MKIDWTERLLPQDRQDVVFGVVLLIIVGLAVTVVAYGV
jgi:hypothetical protein